MLINYTQYQAILSNVDKLATVVEGDPKVSISIATTPSFWEGRYSFPCIAPLYP